MHFNLGVVGRFCMFSMATASCVVGSTTYSLSNTEELDFDREPVGFGVFGTSNAEYIAAIGASASRTLIWDTNINRFNMPRIVRSLREMREVGIEQTIVTIRWPVDEGENSFFDRIPSNFEAALERVDYFLTSTEGLVDWVQIQNEPFGGPGSYSSTNELEDAVSWWIAVAEYIDQYNLDNGTNIKIVSPGLTGFGLVIDGVNENVRLIHEGIIGFANDYCDAVDFHLNTTSISRLTELLDYIDGLDPQPQVPKMILEWSQAKAARDYVALPENAAFLDIIYEGNPVSVQDWQGFVEAAPLDSNFMVDAMRLFQERGYLVACYATVLQFSKTEEDRNFDVTALYSQNTTGGINRSQPLFDQLASLSSRRQVSSNQLRVGNPEPAPGGFTHIELKFPVFPATKYQLYYSAGGPGQWERLGEAFSSTSEEDAELTVVIDSDSPESLFFRYEAVNSVSNDP